MRTLGFILAALGVIGMGVSFLAGLVGPMMLTGSFSLFATGIVIGGLGAIEDAIRQTSKDQIEALHQGFESLAKRDAPAQPVNTTGPIPVYRTTEAIEPVAPMPAETGKCPNCGRPRLQFTPKCEACGSTRPVEFA